MNESYTFIHTNRPTPKYAHAHIIYTQTIKHTQTHTLSSVVLMASYTVIRVVLNRNEHLWWQVQRRRVRAEPPSAWNRFNGQPRKRHKRISVLHYDGQGTLDGREARRLWKSHQGIREYTHIYTSAPVRIVVVISIDYRHIPASMPKWAISGTLYRKLCAAHMRIPDWLDVYLSARFTSAQGRQPMNQPIWVPSGPHLASWTRHS